MWLVVERTPLNNIEVNWDDYSQYMEKIRNVPNHQSEMVYNVVYNHPLFGKSNEHG